MKLTDNPCRNTAALMALSRMLFDAAERDRNPKVKDIFDASIYCSTCLSVGYGDFLTLPRQTDRHHPDELLSRRSGPR
jgi:hypothetical protein